MDTIFHRDIKGLIEEFPEVGTILERFKVGCTTCQVGTCLLKDIVNIHPLSPDAELENKDKAALTSRLTAYGELLKDHIKREDDILYPWLDRQLTMQQIGQIFARFAEVDDTFKAKVPACQEFIETLEKS